eukprot:GGOE01004208.1.p1 GENE.GGOE01004208.1~~GGOE01004208.1.p1  ORF type:complete len:1481 (-),score=452.78 GGOE01004208.1:481-4887(-)
MSDSRHNKKASRQEYEKNVIKIQSWWRMVAARLELVRRWEKVQERERRAENAWWQHSGRHIDSPAETLRKALKETQKTETKLRTAIWNQYQRETLDLQRHLRMAVHQTVYVFPRVFVEQREMVARQDILKEEFQSFLPFIEVQEDQLRLLLQGSEVILRHMQYAKLERGWRQRVMDAPLEEMKSRSALTREEHSAWALRLATFNRMKRALQNLQDIQELLDQEAQARERRIAKSMQQLEQAEEEERAAQGAVRQQEADALTARFAQEQRALMAEEELQRAAALEDVARGMPPLAEEAEAVTRQQRVTEEGQARCQLGDRLAVQVEEAHTRMDLVNQQKTIFGAVGRQQLEDRQRLHLWDQGILAEARARVGILFAERDDWFTALRAELECMEAVHRQGTVDEELAERGKVSAVHDRFLQSSQQTAQRLALEEEEEQARAMEEAEEAAERQFTVTICDFLWGDSGFRERLQRQEKQEWSGIEDLFHLDSLQLVETLERTIMGREEDLAWRFVWDKGIVQEEDVHRQALLGGEVREWHLLSVSVAKDMNSVVKEYSEALAARQADQRAAFEAEEGEARQVIQSEHFFGRRGILEEELAERVGLLEAEAAEAQRAADMRTAHAHGRQQEELEELAQRQALEQEEVEAFQFMAAVRKLLRLEENTRRLVLDEEQRRHQALADRGELYQVEVEECLRRAKLAQVDEETWEEMQTLAGKGRAQAELDTLVNRARLDREEELRHIEDFECSSRRRLEALEQQNFNPFPLLLIESLEHIIRKEVEMWEAVGRTKRAEQEFHQRSEIQEIEVLAAQEVAALQRQEALDRSRREWVAEQQRVHQLERADFEGEEARLRQRLLQMEAADSYGFPFERLEAEAQLSQQLLAVQLGQQHRQAVELSVVFAESAKRAVLISAEERIERQLLACELAESNDRVKQFTVPEAMARAHLGQVCALGAEEGAARAAIEGLGQQRFQGIAARGVAAHGEQSRADVLQEYLRLRGGILRFEAEDRQEAKTQLALGLVEMEEPKYRKRLLQQERGAFFASLGIPFLELNEASWRRVHQQSTVATLTGLMTEVGLGLANEQLWLDQRELQIEEAKHRRRLGQEEDAVREELRNQCSTGAAAVREAELRRQAQRKQQAMERLHFNIIERDTRHSIAHAEGNSWSSLQEAFVQGYQEVVDQMDFRSRAELKRAKQKAEKAEKARQVAQAREARLAELQADLDASLVQTEEDPSKAKVPSSLVVKKREAWASADKVKAGDDQSKEAQAKRSAAGSPLKYVESSRSPLRQIPVRRLESLSGQSLRSIYSHYCREYGVPTKPQVLSALPKVPGDFQTRHFSIGAKGSPLFTRPDTVVVGDVALGDTGLLPVLEVVKACPALHTLVLRGCGIQDSAEEIVEVALHHPCLTSIDLTDNPIAFDGVQSLIHLASHNPRISSIQLDEELLAPTQQVDLNSSLGSNLGSRGNRLLPVSLA